MNTDRVILELQKLAANTGVSWESFTDWVNFDQYVP